MDGRWELVPFIAHEVHARNRSGGRDEYVRDRKRETGPVRVYSWRCSVDG